MVVKMARENTGWGYDRIVGALANLGHHLSDQTVGNILRRHGIAPAPKRSRTTSWKDFISAHKDVLAGTDFFTVEVLTLRGLVTYYVLFFIQLESRRVSVAGITRPRSGVDGTDRPQRDPGGLGPPSSMPLCPA
jgi:putative transposase